MNKFIFNFLLLFPMVSYAGTILPEVSDSRYIEYGKQHKCVVKILGKLRDSKDANAYAFGSAVVLGPRWVITAAHVTYSIENDAYILLDEEKISIDQIVVHPDFSFNDSLSMSDIALCHTNKDFDLDFYPELYSDEDELGKICSISGYGATGTGFSGANINDNNKRAGSNKIFEITDNLLRCDMSKQNPTELEFLIAHGDSGGGLFINKKLAGINSFVASDKKKPDSKFGDESGHTRISKFRTWILKNIK